MRRQVKQGLFWQPETCRSAHKRDEGGVCMVVAQPADRTILQQADF